MTSMTEVTTEVTERAGAEPRVEKNGHLPGWFEVDRAGLARQQAAKHPSFAAFELIQNGLDQNVTRVTVTLEPDEHRDYTMITVEDDDPNGFTDIAHAYTMFAKSEKIYDSRKRGQFNVGEKYVLAMSKYAEVATTSGTIIFHEDGTRQQLRKGTEKGTVFKAVVRMTAKQRAETETILQTLIPPPDIAVTVNGVQIQPRKALKEISASLNTMVPDRENAMRPTIRKTIVRVYPVRKGEVATLYERGIPVVPMGDKWHYDVDQKVMLSIDRDNVRPAYLKLVRLVVVNAMYESMTADDWHADWGKQVRGDRAISPEAFKASVQSRFGDKVVRRDPSDQEANNLAVSKGYTVVEPRTLSKEEWKNANRVGNIEPAGRVTPSNSTLESLTVDKKLKIIPEGKWRDGEKRLAVYAKALAKLLIEQDIAVEIFSDITVPLLAAYGGRKLIFNRGCMSHQFGPSYGTEITEGIDALLIHELGHEKASNHLDEGFHGALCALAAKAIRLAPAIRLAAGEGSGARRRKSLELHLGSAA